MILKAKRVNKNQNNLREENNKFKESKNKESDKNLLYQTDSE